MSNEAEKLADALGSRVVRQWTHSTGESPRAMGFKHDAECQRAAALLRRQAEQIRELREALETLKTSVNFKAALISANAEVMKVAFADDQLWAAVDMAMTALSNTKDQ